MNCKATDMIYRIIAAVMFCFGLIFAVNLGITGAEASVVLKVAVVNPSPDMEKEVELNVPLPQEVGPDDIISLGDLELDFDAQRNVYYVHKIFTLEPKGSIVREVEIRDVWQVDNEELESLRQEAEKLWELAKNSEYAPQANFLRNAIDSKLNQIMQLQEAVTVTPQEHISNYRKNLERLQEIKADIESLTSIAGRVKPISAKLIWRLILLVVGFLGIIAVIFMFIWNRYLKSPELEKLKVPEEGEL